MTCIGPGDWVSLVDDQPSQILHVRSVIECAAVKVEPKAYFVGKEEGILVEKLRKIPKPS